MKISFWKLLLTCLLLATLPLKGLAGVSVLGCESLAPASAAPASAGTQHAHPAEHVHAAELVADHFAQADMANADAGGHGADTVHLKCSACSSCCVGSALTPTTAVFWPEFASHTGFADPVFPLPSALLSSLERPPRALRA